MHVNSQTQRIVIRHLGGSKINQLEQFDLIGLSRITLGTDPSSTIAYDSRYDVFVDPRHAEIRISTENGLACRIADLNSTYGTFLNGEQVFGSVELLPDDVVQLSPDGPIFAFDVVPRLELQPREHRLKPAESAERFRLTEIFMNPMRQIVREFKKMRTFRRWMQKRRELGRTRSGPTNLPVRTAPTNAPPGAEAKYLSLSQLVTNWTDHQAIDKIQAAEPDGTKHAGYQGRFTDKVDVSVFAPPRVSLRSPFYVQALIHDHAQLVRAAQLAARQDPAANRRGFATLQARVGLGAVIELYLDCESFLIDRPLQIVTWEGEPTHAVFGIEIVDNSILQTSVAATVHISVAGVPVGEVAFDVYVSSKTDRTSEATAKGLLQGPDKSYSPGSLPAKTANTSLSVTASEKPEPVGSSAICYRNAFISYSRKDFEIVSFFAQGLEEAEIKLCMDVKDLEPGDDWSEKLSRYIEDADVFYLMWSENAAASKMVDLEARQAVQLYDNTDRRRPRIKPVALKAPWPHPPEYLQRFQFYSVWHAHRVAQQIDLISATRREAK